MTREMRLATALADAMLAGPWKIDKIHQRLHKAVGRRPRWLRDLAVEVLDTYLRPPTDRPRELAKFVLYSSALERARRKKRPLPTAAVQLTRPTAVVYQPFHTPRLDNAGALAAHLGLDTYDLEVLADASLKARRAHSPRIAHYRYHWLPRPAGARLLEAPKPRLKRIQRHILDDLLAPIPVHPAAHGFVSGRSAISGAAAHTGADTVISLDLENFFASITAGRVWGVLRSAGYPEPVAYLLTGLTTHATPVAVLSMAPAGPDLSRDFRMRRRLAAPHLPQGAATSPQLANLVAFSLDRRLAAYATAMGVTYTRYADDLTFSGGDGLGRAASTLITAVEKMVREEGFQLNRAKTRVRQKHQKQTVTGIVVNEKTNISRPDYDLLKAILHDCRVNGPRAANRHGRNDFRSHLLGRIGWVSSLNPARGAKLRQTFDAIDWSR